MGRRFSREFGKPGEHYKEIMKVISFFFAAMFYIYILYSQCSNRYYVGHTNDPERRLIEHNTTDEVKYTSKYRPWEMVLCFEVSENRGDAVKIEKFIKRQKSSIFLRKLIDTKEDKSFFRTLINNVLG